VVTGQSINFLNSEALLDLLCDQELHQRLKANGIHTAELKFSWADKIDRLEEVLTRG